jgi:hypothetical protein
MASWRPANTYVYPTPAFLINLTVATQPGIYQQSFPRHYIRGRQFELRKYVLPEFNILLIYSWMWIEQLFSFRNIRTLSHPRIMHLLSLYCDFVLHFRDVISFVSHSYSDTAYSMSGSLQQVAYSHRSFKQAETMNKWWGVVLDVTKLMAPASLLRRPNNKTRQSRLNRNTKRSHIQSNKERTIHTWNVRLTQSTALQQQQQPYPVTPEDGQLGRNM